MPDTMTPQQRHYCMSRIRSKDTTPEKRVRQWLWQHGYRYRLCVKGVPGKPDIVMRKYRTAIFVNGCFWHGHDFNVQCTMNNVQLRIRNAVRYRRRIGIFGWRKYGEIRRGIRKTMRFFLKMGGR